MLISLIIVLILSGCHNTSEPEDGTAGQKFVQVVLDDSYFRMIGLTADGNIHVNAVETTSTNKYTTDVTTWKGVKKIAAGYMNVAAVKKDGTVLYDNLNSEILYRGRSVIVREPDGREVTHMINAELPHPLLDVSDWTDIVSVACGNYHIAGLKKDGTVVARETDFEQPPGPGHNGVEVSSWTDIVEIAAGMNFTAGLREDGTVVTSPALWSTQYRTERTDTWTDVIAISASQWGLLGLRADGTVMAAGPMKSQFLLSDWKDIQAVVSCENLSVGLRKDGTVVTSFSAFSAMDSKELASWTDIVAIEASDFLVIGQKADGSMVTMYNRNYSANITAFSEEFDKWNEAESHP